MPLLSIRDLIKVYQTDEGIFGKTKRRGRAVNASRSTSHRVKRSASWANPAAARPRWDA
jgi:hypothetical protein